MSASATFLYSGLLLRSVSSCGFSVAQISQSAREGKHMSMQLSSCSSWGNLNLHSDTLVEDDGAKLSLSSCRMATVEIHWTTFGTIPCQTWLQKQ